MNGVNTKRVWLSVVLTLACGCVRAVAADAPVAHAAASVNGVVIPHAALRAMMARMRPGSGAHPDGADEARALRAAALDRLIVLELAHQKAVASGIRISDAEVDGALRSEEEAFGDPEAFRADLARRGYTEAAFREEVRRSLAVDRLHGREVLDKAVVSEAALLEAFASEKGRFAKPEHIVIVDVFWKSSPGSAAARAPAEIVRARLESDPTHDPWKLVLDGSFLVRRYQPRPPRDEVLAAEARRVGEGGLSRVLEAGDGTHVFKVIEYRPAAQATLDDARSLLEARLAPAARARREREWELELRQGAQIEIMTGAAE